MRLSKTLASLWNSTKMQVFTSKQSAFEQMKRSLGLSTGIDEKVRGSSSVVCTSNSSCSSEHVHYLKGLKTVPQRRYLRRRSACHMYLRSGKCSGILILRKSWMHFSSSSSTVNFSFAGRFLQVLVSRELAVSVRSRSLLRRCSDCCCCRRC